MTDAHNHLQDTRFDSIRSRIIAEMLESGITHCVVNGTSPADWPQVAELAKKHPNFITPSFGLHPWQQPTDGWLEKLLDYLDDTPHACIGECGLDRWMKDYDLERQKHIFIAQLAIASDRNLPLSIHCLKAWGPLLDILENHPLPARGFLLHSYSGSTELVPQFSKLGAYFSFSGYFLHPRKSKVIETFQTIPKDRLLLETDAPDMLPPRTYITHPLADSLNHPGNLATIATAISELLDISLVENNAQRFFR